MKPWLTWNSPWTTAWCLAIMLLPLCWPVARAHRLAQQADIAVAEIHEGQRMAQAMDVQPGALSGTNVWGGELLAVARGATLTIDENHVANEACGSIVGRIRGFRAVSVNGMAVSVGPNRLLPRHDVDMACRLGQHDQSTVTVVFDRTAPVLNAQDVTLTPIPELAVLPDPRLSALRWASAQSEDPTWGN